MAKPRAGLPKGKKPPKKPGMDHGKLGLHRVEKNRYTKGGQTFKRTSKGFKKLRKGRPAPKAPKDDPLQPLSGKTMRRETESAAKLKYGPSEQQLQSQRRISDQSAVNQGGWWDDYINKVNSAGQAVQGAYSGAQQGVYNQANTARTQDDAQQARIAADMQESAKQRGTVAQPDQGGSAAAASRQALSSSFGGLIGAQGANAQAYMGARSAAGGLHKLRALQDERSRRGKIESQAGELASEKGQFKVEYRGKLREGERTYALNRQNYGLKVAEAGERQRHSKAQEKNVRTGYKTISKDKASQRRLTKRMKTIDAQLRSRSISVQEQSALERKRHNLAQERNSLRKGSGGGKSSKPTEGSRNKYATIQNFSADARNYLGGKRDKKSVSKARQLLAKNQKAGWLQRNAALELALSKRLSPGTYQALKDAGVHLPKHWKPR